VQAWSVPKISSDYIWTVLSEVPQDRFEKTTLLLDLVVVFLFLL
jgi:hypothetical protein